MSSEEENEINLKQPTKKRKLYGRLSDVNKKIRLQSHETGSSCNCKRYKCFEAVNKEQRARILKDFNLLPSRDEQNLYLCGLISVLEIQRRRPRKEEAEAKLHTANYAYRVRLVDETQQLDVPVCASAFIAIHGVTRQRICTIKKSLLTTGKAPIDKRGKHSNRPKKLSSILKSKVMDHIRSFRGRKSHYSLHDSSKIYLPEELNVKKMYDMFEDKNQLSYETYRSIFVNHFNIGFGYPRSDTCSTCDEFLAKTKALKVNLKNASELEKGDIEKEIKKLETENKLHKLKANVFYKRKRETRIQCQSSSQKEAIAMDFQKNLSMPNITTNDVYYKRQLTLNLFNIHELSTSKSYFFCYPESIAKKGSDEVCSFLHHYIFNMLDKNTRELVIFCDSCGGQNKNYTVFRFIHYVVHSAKRLDVIKIIFPIRGHSYLECDRNMGCINQKSPCETPDEWVKVIREARQKPCPFHVIEVDQPLVRKWTTFLSPMYKKTCPFLSRPIREIRVEKDHPRLIFHREHYNASWTSSILMAPKKKSKSHNDSHSVSNSEFVLPDQSYKESLPVSKAKFMDIQALSKFCGPKAKQYFSQIKYNDT